MCCRGTCQRCLAALKGRHMSRLRLLWKSARGCAVSEMAVVVACVALPCCNVAAVTAVVSVSTC